MMHHAAMDHGMMGHEMDHGSMSHGSMHPGMNGSHHNMHMSHGGMQMYFFLGGNVTLFFKEWITNNSNAKIIGACCGLMIVGILYEGLKVWRQYLLSKNCVKPSTVMVNKQGNGTFISELVQRNSEKKKSVNRLSLHVLQAFLHVLQIFIGYMLMLAFMTYNVWICVAVLVGAGFGYLIFGWYIPESSGNPNRDSHCY